MTTTPPNGGPAFPVPYMGKPGDWTVRDEFAKGAMQARIIALGSHKHEGKTMDQALREVDKCHTETAERAYRHADAMLAERAKQQKGTTP